MSIRKTIASLLGKLSGATAPAPAPVPTGKPSANLSPKDREFLRNLLDGMTAQVRHEADMNAERKAPRGAIRLVPQVPIIDGDGGRAWLGGGARLPQGMDWPVIDGAPLQLLAQIDLGALPRAVWDGVGPRAGWLAIFAHPETMTPKVFHFAEVGDFKPSPPVGADLAFLGYDGRKKAESCGFTGRFPRWPMRIEAAPPGDEGPHRPFEKRRSHVRYAQQYDLLDDGLVPFDWATARAMMTLVVTEFEQAMPKAAQPPWFAPEAIAKAEADIVAARARGADAEALAGLQVRRDEMVATAAVRAYGITHGPRVLATLHDVANRIDAMAAAIPFAQARIAPLLMELRNLTWMHKSGPGFYLDGKKLSEVERLAIGYRVFTMPLTRHDKDARPGWVHAFATSLLDAAKPVYIDAPDRLHVRLCNQLEALLADQAIDGIAGMGHVPWRYVHEFDLDKDVTLLELPSSDLMGWQFGDVDNLVLTMKKSDLARGNFSRVLMQVTN